MNNYMQELLMKLNQQNSGFSKQLSLGKTSKKDEKNKHSADYLNQLAAKAGKHVFCEKPLCLTFQDAQAAIAACNQAGVQLGIGHERRFEPAVMTMREEIAKGTLGVVLQIEANFSQDKFFALPPDNWRLSNKFAPVGPLTATGIHLVDLAIAILGPAESVWAPPVG
jgi:predicted dehydrogenase